MRSNKFYDKAFSLIDAPSGSFVDEKRDLLTNGQIIGIKIKAKNIDLSIIYV